MAAPKAEPARRRWGVQDPDTPVRPRATEAHNPQYR